MTRNGKILAFAAVIIIAAGAVASIALKNNAETAVAPAAVVTTAVPERMWYVNVPAVIRATWVPWWKWGASDAPGGMVTWEMISDWPGALAGAVVPHTVRVTVADGGVPAAVPAT